MPVTQLKTAVGFVGLGTMGGRMAGRLLAAGHEVHGTTGTVAEAQPLIDRGLIWHATPREVAAAARDVVFSMVSDDAALEAITAGPDGILDGLPPGTIYVDLSTVKPATSVAIAGHVRMLGGLMLDSPVSGGVAQADTGTLTIMVGGDELGFRFVEPLLRDLGRTVIRVGGNGQGLLLKLAINMSRSVQTLGFSEGLLLAERGGIDPGVAARLMSESLRVTLPSAATADSMLAQPRELGYGKRAVAALYHVLGRLNATAARGDDYPNGEPALAPC
jgi:3-hydroxyisobutyrate dehydrogenase-like beta-hydroxyacid dehydrogenase